MLTVQIPYIFYKFAIIKHLIIMATVTFLFRSTKSTANLSCRLLYRHKDKDLVFGSSTKLEVSKEYWTKSHKQKRPKDIEIANKQVEINNELNKISKHILTAFKSIDPSLIDKKWVEAQIDRYYNPHDENADIPKALTPYIEYYIDYRKNELKEGLIKKIRVTKHKLERFQTFRNKIILIKDVNDKFKNEFVDYCKSLKYSQNTTERDLAWIKTFCKHARYIGLETNSQLDSLRLDKQKIESIYLNFADLEKLENIDDRDFTESLKNARDWLIISCYTGQRISDFMRFTDKMIRVEKGKNLLEFTQQKTGKSMTVPLHSKVIEILASRKGLFPNPISDQKYNDYIKEVCRLAKLDESVAGSKMMQGENQDHRKKSGIYKKWELVTSHIGRRSFATNFYGNIPTMYLINVTGHSTEVMFLKYIGKSNKDLAMELINYF